MRDRFVCLAAGSLFIVLYLSSLFFWFCHVREFFSRDISLLTSFSWRELIVFLFCSQPLNSWAVAGIVNIEICASYIEIHPPIPDQSLRSVLCPGGLQPIIDSYSSPTPPSPLVTHPILLFLGPYHGLSPPWVFLLQVQYQLYSPSFSLLLFSCYSPSLVNYRSYYISLLVFSYLSHLSPGACTVHRTVMPKVKKISWSVKAAKNSDPPWISDTRRNLNN